MIGENMVKLYQYNVKGIDDKRGIAKLKDLLSLPIDEFTQIINEQKSLIDAADEKLGYTLLSLSVQNQLDQQTKILLDKGANPNKQNRYGDTPLHIAIEKLNHKIVNLLLDKQANPNIKQEYGETAMHVAARKGDYKVLKLLLLYKGDHTIRANDGSLPIDVAQEYCNDKCIQILESEQKKQNIKQTSSRQLQEEANGLINPTRVLESPIKTKSQKRIFEEYDYIQYPPPDQLPKKHQYGSKSFNINKASLFGDLKMISSSNIKENGINSINIRLRQSMVLTEKMNQLSSSRYKNDNEKNENINNSIQTPKSYKPKLKEDNVDYFANKPKILINSKKNDIKVNTFHKGNTLKSSLTINILKNSIRLTKSFIEEIINDRDLNPFCDNIYQSKGSQDLYNKLKEINMEKYTDLLVNEGFDDLKLFINETKYLNDSHLKLIGITKPGHRAKILIKIESESKRLTIKLNHETVFYNANDPSNHISDPHLYSLFNWLKNYKLEQYYNTFVEMGYHSIELLYTQMITNNPLTDDSLKNEFHIEKLGHRIRILNQLNEDSQIYVNKLQTIECTHFESESQKKNSCTCTIY